MSNNECRPWKGPTTSSGYPRPPARAKVRPDEAALLEAMGTTAKPAQVELVKSCNNKLCCNPAHLSFQGTDLASRLWRKVPDRPRNGCWPWQGAKGGLIQGTDGKVTRVRRAVLELSGPPIPSELDVVVTCGNQDCVNPDHLEAVPVRDRILRGNGACARNAAKETCPKGHPLSGDNLVVDDRGRRCRTCKLEAEKERKREKFGYRRQLDVPLTHCPAGHEYTPENTYVTKGGSKTCRTCNSQRRHRDPSTKVYTTERASVPWQERFWSKVLKHPPVYLYLGHLDTTHLDSLSPAEKGCWEWIGKRTNGYGQFHFSFKETNPGTEMAHRLSYLLSIGPIEAGLHLDHLCRNPSCVNPEHLEPVTPHENVLRSRKARSQFCVNGHEFTEENTYRAPGGTHRYCKECRRVHGRKKSKKPSSDEKGSKLET